MPANSMNDESGKIYRNHSSPTKQERQAYRASRPGFRLFRIRCRLESSARRACEIRHS